MKNWRLHKGETIVYLVLWIVLFMAPVITLHFHRSGNVTLHWHDFTAEWVHFSIIFVIFLLHNFLLAPMLIYRKQRLLYFSCLVVIFGCFITFQCISSPVTEGPRPGMELSDQRPPDFDDRFDEMGPPPLPGEEGYRAPDIDSDKESKGAGMEGDKEPKGPEMEGDERKEHRPPFIFGQHDLMASLMLLFILGMNIGVKLYFKQRQDERRFIEQEKERLHQQLEYLRYQINPHFLMNTLNNIHALVDIDSERAKETIVELSKIMRYALYEGNHQMVPLAHDIAFLKSYIQLMQLRYTDKVDITVDVDFPLPDCTVPPMIFITFVENAFKHGISYQQESFIKIAITAANNKIVFSCKNSKAPKKTSDHPQEGGVGLQNVKKRMQLIYGEHYSLDIEDFPDSYNILLKLPLQS